MLIPSLDFILESQYVLILPKCVSRPVTSSFFALIGQKVVDANFIKSQRSKIPCIRKRVVVFKYSFDKKYIYSICLVEIFKKWIDRPT